MASRERLAEQHRQIDDFLLRDQEIPPSLVSTRTVPYLVGQLDVPNLSFHGHVNNALLVEADRWKLTPAVEVELERQLKTGYSELAADVAVILSLKRAMGPFVRHPDRVRQLLKDANPTVRETVMAALTRFHGPRPGIIRPKAYAFVSQFEPELFNNLRDHRARVRAEATSALFWPHRGRKAASTTKWLEKNIHHFTAALSAPFPKGREVFDDLWVREHAVRVLLQSAPQVIETHKALLEKHADLTALVASVRPGDDPQMTRVSSYPNAVSHLSARAKKVETLAREALAKLST